MLKLFYAPGSCALAAHIALEDAGADYQAVRMDLKAGDQAKPEYLAVNPKARVPALITDHGVLTESLAILAYVAQTFPQARLAPLDDPFAFGRMQAFNSYLATTLQVAHAHRHRGYRWADDPAALAEMTRKVPETVAACFDLIEREMFEGPWVMGEAYTVADPYLFTMSSWMELDRVDPERFPRVLDHRNRMAQRPAVRKVLAEHAGA
jgi:glutathione S-transferase